MKTKQAKPADTFVDPDDAPAWTKDQFERAEFAIGGEVIRPAQGTLTRKAGRPRVAAPKQIVSLRLEPEVIEAYRATGAGWQSRMGEVLKAGIHAPKGTKIGSTKQSAGPYKGVTREPASGAFKSSGNKPERKKTAS